MLEKLLELFVSAKAGAVSGAIILAGGAIVSASTSAGVATVAMQDPTPTPIVQPLEGSEPFEFEVTLDEPTEGAEETQAPPADPGCGDDAAARQEARQRVHETFTKYHTALGQLRSELGGRGSAKAHAAIEQADALLKEIRTHADRAIVEMRCGRAADVDEVLVQAAALALRGDAASMHEVADRAQGAMETVYNLARATVLAEIEALRPKPTAKPTAKPTTKPRNEWGKAREKPARCDDQMYAAKKQLHEVFEEVHGANDKLIWELKKWAAEGTLSALHRADKVMHETYDRTKEAIHRAGCATGESGGMALAERAGAVLRQTFSGSRGVAQAAMVHRPDRQKCEEQMSAAKRVLYANYERLHGANDKLWKISEGWSGGTRAAIENADRIIHGTYDRTKEAIYRAACGPNGSNAMELAANAAGIFETAHNSARRAVGKELTGN